MEKTMVRTANQTEGRGLKIILKSSPFTINKMTACVQQKLFFSLFKISPFIVRDP